MVKDSVISLGRLAPLAACHLGCSSEDDILVPARFVDLAVKAIEMRYSNVSDRELSVFQLSLSFNFQMTKHSVT
jgi:hypothetical protein